MLESLAVVHIDSWPELREVTPELVQGQATAKEEEVTPAAHVLPWTFSE